MHKFLIYLSIYFRLTCFGLSFSPSSEAGVQLRQWFWSPGYGVSARAPEDGLKESPKHVRQKQIDNKLKTCTLHWSLHSIYNFTVSTVGT
jgi:hypothetical protein